jgi:hypothetical protein
MRRRNDIKSGIYIRTDQLQPDMNNQTPNLIYPTMAEVKLQAAKAGLPEVEAEKFFYFYESKGWKVGKTAMKSWLSALAGWKLRWIESHNEAQTMVMEKEYERVMARLKAIPEIYDGHREWSKAHRDEFQRLKVRRDELRRKLGIML